jgi:selenocysteine lyase/cysteine desulfurase
MARAAIDWAAIRALFPATQRQAYLDTASFGPGPTPVVEAVSKHLEEWSCATGSWRAWDEVGEVVRARLAALLETESSHIALMPALSAAAGQVAETLPFEPGANIVVGQGEFQSNYYPWVNQERRGFEIRNVPFVEGRLLVDEFARRVDERTALVAASHVQSVSGFRLDLEGLVDLCRRHDARLFIDATQSLGALRVPTEGIDYIAGAAYKWLLSPRGSAFLYVRPERAAELAPLMPNWKTHDVPYRDYYGPPFEPPPDARRFDLSLAWPVWIGLAAGLELILKLGTKTIEERDLGLAERFRTGLQGVGLQPAFSEAETSQIVGLRVRDPRGVQRSLAENHVIAAVRGEFVRFAFHFFNDESDVERALEALRV